MESARAEGQAPHGRRRRQHDGMHRPDADRTGGSGRSLRAGRALRRAYAQAERTAALTVNPASI